MASTHPTDKLVSLYASGEATEGVALAVAAHLTYCPSCRARVEQAEAIAAALMTSDQSDDALELPNIGAVLARLDDDEAGMMEAEAPCASASKLDAGPLPTAVSAKVGLNFADIPWRFRLPGVSEYEMTSSEGDSISLLRVKPGVAIPQHTHEGEELTVVFSGVLEDGGISYGVGAMSVADHDVDHHPRAGAGEVCICLAVVSGGLRFTGRFGRALNLFS